MKTFLFVDHQGKGIPFADALERAGYNKSVNYRAPADFILIDSDVPARVKLFERMFSISGKRMPVFIYPHSARPWLAWDGIFAPWPGITANFVGTQEHVNILRAYGYKLPVHAVGWTLCPQHRFRPSEAPNRVLFAPIHPNNNGWLSDFDKAINASTFLKLLKLRTEGKISRLTVRHIHDLQRNGLWKDARVRIIEGQPNGEFKQIDVNDVVVAHQTFAYIAVARGKPVVMMGEAAPARCGNNPLAFQFVKSWDKYKDMLMYPLDILAEHTDPLEVLKQACAGSPAVTDWRRRMIGQPFNEHQFIKFIRQYVEKVPSHSDGTEE